MTLQCCYYTENFWEFFEVSDRVARKEHRCAECGTGIVAGDLYRYERGVWDGEFDQHKMCEVCMDLADSMNALGYCFDWGGLKAAHAELIGYE